MKPAFAGERFSLPLGSRLQYECLGLGVPLLIGTWSPKLAAFAGEAAQELKVGGSANPDVVPVMRERIGNDDVRIVFGAVTVVDEDGERARAIARREVAMYLDVVAKLDPTLSVDPTSDRGPGEIRTTCSTGSRSRGRRSRSSPTPRPSSRRVQDASTSGRLTACPRSEESSSSARRFSRDSGPRCSLRCWVLVDSARIAGARD